MSKYQTTTQKVEAKINAKSSKRLIASILDNVLSNDGLCEIFMEDQGPAEIYFDENSVTVFMRNLECWRQDVPWEDLECVDIETPEQGQAIIARLQGLIEAIKKEMEESTP